MELLRQRLLLCNFSWLVKKPPFLVLVASPITLPADCGSCDSFKTFGQCDFRDTRAMLPAGFDFDHALPGRCKVIVDWCPNIRIDSSLDTILVVDAHLNMYTSPTCAMLRISIEDQRVFLIFFSLGRIFDATSCMCTMVMERYGILANVSM